MTFNTHELNTIGLAISCALDNYSEEDSKSLIESLKDIENKIEEISSM